MVIEGAALVLQLLGEPPTPDNVTEIIVRNFPQLPEVRDGSVLVRVSKIMKRLQKKHAARTKNSRSLESIRLEFDGHCEAAPNPPEIAMEADDGDLERC